MTPDFILCVILEAMDSKLQSILGCGLLFVIALLFLIVYVKQWKLRRLTNPKRDYNRKKKKFG